MSFSGTLFLSIADIKDSMFQKEDNVGYVYILENETNIKIGKTSNPVNRLRQLSNSNTGGLKPLRVFITDGMYIDQTIEKIMHSIYSKERVEGEWFANLDFSEVRDQLIQLCNSKDFIKCNKVRMKFLQSI